MTNNCIFIVIILLFFFCLSCQNKSQPEIPFDKTKWSIKEDLDYPYRNQMVNEVLYSDSIRTLQKESLIELLGQPDYIREKHFYYRINETRLGAWILHTKTIVIKLSDDDTIDWIKLHE